MVVAVRTKELLTASWHHFSHASSTFKNASPREQAWDAATRVLPCISWMRRYNVKEQLFKDVAAGIAVTCLIIPQGLSYAGVAGLPAIYGLYTDFLPLFIFFAYTSSQYLQVGAVAVVSLLTSACARCDSAKLRLPSDARIFR